MPQAMPTEKTRGSTLEWSASRAAAPYVLLGPRRLTSELQTFAMTHIGNPTRCGTLPWTVLESGKERHRSACTTI
jgi:hypothetical protein